MQWVLGRYPLKTLRAYEKYDSLFAYAEICSAFTNTRTSTSVPLATFIHDKIPNSIQSIYTHAVFDIWQQQQKQIYLNISYRWEIFSVEHNPFCCLIVDTLVLVGMHGFVILIFFFLLVIRCCQLQNSPYSRWINFVNKSANGIENFSPPCVSWTINRKGKK